MTDLNKVNQMSEPIEKHLLFQTWGETATTQGMNEAIKQLAELLGVEFYRTNATKHGTVELVMRKVK